MDHPPHSLSTNSFITHISKQYGAQTSSIITKYMTGNTKLAKLISKRIFLLQCKTNNIIPKHISNACKQISGFTQNTPFTQKRLNLQKRTEKTILNLEIKECHWTISNRQNTLTQLIQKLTCTMSQTDLNNFIFTQNKHFQTIHKNSNRSLKNKITTLKNNQQNTPKFYYDENCIKNLTDEDIPTEAKVLLSLGPKFNMPTALDTRKNAIDLIAATENAIRDISNTNKKDEIRKTATHEIKKHTKKEDNNNINKFLKHCETTTNRYFKHKQHLFILNSDKGNVTVIMQKDDYFNKMDQHLNDDQTYTALNEDPTTILQRKNNRIVIKMENKHYINKLKRKQLTTDTAVAPRLYGLPKIHKENTPMRPVICNINSPSYHLSKFMCNILQEINKNSKYNIKNSEGLINFLKDVTLHQNDILISLDVESLYTNVDMDLVLKIIDNKWQTIENITPIDKVFFLEIIKFCVIDCNYFTFNKKFYKQKFGLAMGNPLSGVLAEIALDYIIDQALKNLTQKPTFIKKYVDDIICAIHKDTESDLIKIFNNTHKRFSFSIEKEKDKGIPFLDLLLIRTKNLNIITDWYIKPCSSKRILNFYSNHPYHTRINTAQAYANRAIFASHHTFRQKNIKTIKEILNKNNYPENIINTIIQKAIRRQHFYKEPENTESVPTFENTTSIYTSLPFIQPISSQLARIIKKENNNIKIAFKPTNKLSKTYTKTKDKIDIHDKNDVIYKIECNDCKKVYIGQTSKKLQTRLAQHKSYINKKTPRSALASHTLDTGHIFSFDEAKILETENNKKKRETKESCYIHINKNNAVNLRIDTEQIDQEYKHILQQYNI